ncbi:MAG: polysaccharide deacetylase family protein [Anaerolineales bacterium]
MKNQFQKNNYSVDELSFPVNIPILAYHQIVDDKMLSNNHSAYSMPLSQFERQMQYLRDAGYRSITLMEFLHFRRLGLRAQEKMFVLTFDDGYENFLTTAYPILHQHEFTATVFLVAGCIGATNRWDKVMNAPLLSRDQIRKLRDADISFGSHTNTHPHLPDLSSEQIRDELANSKKLLEHILDREIPFLAYPYGESSPRVWEIAMETGYLTGCGVVTGKSGRYNLWRRPCESTDSLLAFGFKLTSRYYQFLRLLRWAREDTVVGQRLRKVKQQRLSPKTDTRYP